MLGMKGEIKKGIIVALVFVAVGLCGVAFSMTTPHITSQDELVYLTGALQARDHDLPDAAMLQGYDYGSYLYPKMMLWAYEDLGYGTFKAVYLMVLVVAMGVAGYVLFRVLGLSALYATGMSMALLMPRFAAGLEIFGVLTFYDAIGRAMALPAVLLIAAGMIRAYRLKQPLWPWFGLCGVFMFLHPISLMLFAFISLVALGVTTIAMERVYARAVYRVLVNGIVFVLAGGYFFIDVINRLSPSASSEGVTVAQYVEAVLFRNVWEFPAGTVVWVPHMLIVSAVFIGALVLPLVWPWWRRLYEQYRHPQRSLLLIWGLSIATGSMAFSFLIPGVNLWLMQHADFPYLFQQWSRVAKFYYLGLFIALVPSVYTLAQAVRSLSWRARTGVLVGILLVAMASSTFVFEFAQGVVGYGSAAPSYVPQYLSGAVGDTTPDHYRELCARLVAMGAPPYPVVVSGDFGLRYYCKADLYATIEEGAAFLQLSRAELVDWYTRYMRQRVAFNSGSPQAMVDFAHEVGARFVVMPNSDKFAYVLGSSDLQPTTTKRFIIIPVAH